MIKKGNETCKSRLKPKKLTGEERGLNAENEKREEDGGTDQMEKSESHPIGRGPVWRMKSSHDFRFEDGFPNDFRVDLCNS